MKNILIASLCSCLLLSCKRYLDIKPDKALVVPETLMDMKNLLDNIPVMNVFPALGIMAAGDYHMEPSGLSSLSNPFERNSYLWKKDLYEGVAACPDWNTPYTQVFYANIVLEGLDKIKPQAAEEELWRNLSGSACFFRSWAFYNLAQFFSEPYNKATSSQVRGIPLKLTSDVNKNVGRGTLEETYAQIIKDVTRAVDLLPEKSDYPNRPDKIAAYAFLARVFHNMENYEEAVKYADQCLALKSDLLVYSTLNAAAANPFPRSALGENKEVIFFSSLINYLFFYSGVLYPDASLMALFDDNDLRKSLFFNPSNGRFYNRSYTGDTRNFSGLAVDEVLLIRAESNAWLNRSDKACEDLNRLLLTRYKKDTYIPVQISDTEQLIKLILSERRKQLFSRGLRWIDLRRINKDARFADTLHRSVGTGVIRIYPNDSRYVLTIPQNEIIGSGIEQNNR